MKKNVTWRVLSLFNSSNLMHLIIVMGEHGKTMAFLFPVLRNNLKVNCTKIQ